jgi:hypothetical protein
MVLLLTCPEVMNLKKLVTTGIRLRFENRVRRQKTCALDLIKALFVYIGLYPESLQLIKIYIN